jgi:hypothetical protein
MKKLSPDWITEKMIDFEYKRYVLLAYLQDVSKDFEQSQLYPSLGDLVTHYRNLVKLKESKQEIYGNFPERMQATDLENFQLVFKKILEDDAIMLELENIINFSIPEFEKHLNEGKKIYDFIEAHLNIQPIGVMPLNRGEGYFIFRNGSSRQSQVYEYQVTIFENPNERYRGIYTNHLTSYELNLSNTYESIKSDLIKHHTKLPNPATFAIESEMSFPFFESLMPVAKRRFVKYLSENEFNFLPA